MAGWDDGPVVDAVIAHKKGMTVQQGRTLRDNTIAGLASGTGAPVVASVWHPDGMLRNGDGATGVIYDFAVSGAVASVTSPTFAAGYEYAFDIYAKSGAAGSANGVTFTIAAEVASAPGTFDTVASAVCDANIVGQSRGLAARLEVLRPSQSEIVHGGILSGGWAGAANLVPFGAFTSNHSAATTLTRVQFGLASNFASGSKIIMYRQRLVV